MFHQNTLTLLATTLKTGVEYASIEHHDSALRVKLPRPEIMSLFPGVDYSFFKEKSLSQSIHGSKPDPMDAHVLVSDEGQKVRAIKLTHVYTQIEYMGQYVILMFPFDRHSGTVYNRTANFIKLNFPEFYDKQYHARAKAIIAKLDRRKPSPSIKRKGPPLKRLSNENYKRMVK